MQFTLSKPIDAHGEKVTILELKEPTIKQARRLGMPFTFSSSGMPEPKIDVVCSYIAECASITNGAVEQISLSDITSLSWVIMGFFIRSAEKTEAPLSQLQEEQENLSVI